MRTLIGAVLVLAVGFAGSPVWALFESNEELVKSARITLQEAVSTAVDKVPGKAVSASLDTEDDRTVFEVKVIDRDGTTREVYVDAQSGEVIKIEDE